MRAFPADALVTYGAFVRCRLSAKKPVGVAARVQSSQHGRRPIGRPDPRDQQQPARAHRGGPRLAADRHRLRRLARHRRRAQGGTARPFRPSRAEEIALLAGHAGGRLDRHLPLQAQARIAEGGLRPGDRSLQGPQRRLFLLHRRQRLDGHGQQGRPAGPTSGAWTWSASACPRRSTTTSATASSS